MRYFSLAERISPSPFKDTVYEINDGSDTSPLIGLHRLLSGTARINIHDEFDQITETFIQDINFFTPDLAINNSLKFDHLELEENLNLEEYYEFTNSEKDINKNFYQNILHEISHALIAREKSCYIKSFLFIYRAYEHVSYAFPMIYSQNTKDYENTFEDLKKWMTAKSEGNVGELRFKEKFLRTLFPNEELDATYQIDITGNQEEKKSLFLAIVENCMEWGDPQQYPEGTIKYEKIVIPFQMWNKLILGLRNRFFHLSNSNNKNIKTANLHDPEILFKLILDHCINYFSKIFLTIHLSKFK